MKTWKLLLPLLESLGFGWQVIRYALIFVSAFFRQRASLGCEMVAIRGGDGGQKRSVAFAEKHAQGVALVCHDQVQPKRRV